MYRPRVIPKDAGPDWWQQELQNIASAMQDAQDSVRLNTLYAAPERIYEDMVVRADGVTWDPGSGAGVYARVGGAWMKL
jgi:hypothetical protein